MSYSVEWTQPWDSRDYLHYRHYHSCPELGICTGGCGIFFAEDRVYPFQPGTVIFIPAYMPHVEQNRSQGESSWRYVWISPEVLGEGGFGFLPHEAVSCDRACAGLFGMIYKEVEEKREDRELYKSLCTAFLHIMSRFSEEPGEPENEARRLILPAIAHIAGCYSQGITVAELAKEAHISESTLRRAFVKATGLAPYEYLCAVRVTMAKSLLANTSMAVMEISSCCGFNSLSSFNRHFSKAAGMSPSAFRSLAMDNGQ